jgi:heme exporter protein A
MKINIQNIDKNFGDRRILQNINFSIESGQSAALIGPNGSGKTTLVKIICGLLRPSRGKVEYTENNELINSLTVYKKIGLVSPYLELYEELTARENLNFFGRIKKVPNLNDRIDDLMNRLNLNGREDDPVKTFSSGMRQRLKYVFALLAMPEVLVLDEPTSNLDIDGIDRVYRIMDLQRQDKILIIATNDKSDLKYGDFQIAVDA